MGSLELPRVRRVRVNEWQSGGIAAVFGVAVACMGLSPTGATITDVIVVALAVGVTVWLASSAPWWALAATGGVAALAGFGPIAVVFGIAGAGIAFAIGTTQADASLARTLSAGCTMVALSQLHVAGFFGASTLIGLSGAALLIGLGLARRKRTIRTRVARVAVGVAAFVGIATVATGISLITATDELVEGREFFEAGADHLGDGETAEATADFRRAQEAFENAESSIGRPWAQPGRLVPIVSHHRRAGATAARAGRQASADIGDLTSVLDVDALRPTAGRFDLDTITQLAEPVTRANQTLRRVGDDIDQAQSSWLIGSVQEQIRTADDEFDANIGTFDSLALAFERAPALLGQDRPRHYFVAFTTPAEARGTGGFMGNFAVLTADNGLVTLSDFGRTLDLNQGFGERTVTAPDDWLRRWGRYGFTNGPDDTTSSEPWSNITMSPHFPSTGAAITSLFPQSGGRDVDGVIAIDPYVLEAFVGFTGPITVDGSEAQLTESSTAQFLLFDQYAIESDDRIDALEAVATETMNELLDGALPDPSVLANELGPLVDEERLVAWMVDPADQTLISDIGMAGALPRLDGDDDGLSVVINNAGANKLDAFLTRDVAYEAVTTSDAANGSTVDAELTITLTNSAPRSGLPDGVIGNYVDDPIGTNRSLVTVYTAAPVDLVQVDGTETATEAGSEAGWNLTTFVVVTPAGSSSVIVVEVAGSLTDNDGQERLAPPDADGPGLYIRTQPLVDDSTYEILSTNEDGAVVVEHLGAIPGTRRWATG